MNIQEDYCNFEISKLLSNFEFNGEYKGYYNEAGLFVNTPNSVLLKKGYKYYERPSIYVIMKWLREVHNKNIVLDMIPEGDNCYVLWTFNVLSNKNYKIMWGTKQPKHNSYEEACESAIKYCLENLLTPSTVSEQ